ncbi:MAG TPA: hypothetical protein VGL05_17240 [Kribbella sp.]
MEDLREISAELHRIADAEPMEPLATDQLLDRGRRGRRRRTIFAASGAVAAVAAVAVAVSLMPNLVAADKHPQVATTTTRPQNPDFEPVPGVPHGEEAADQRISQAEAERRCALRNPDEKRQLQRQGYYRAGDGVLYDIKTGQKFAECTIPGGDRPKPALVAAVAADPHPDNTADQLRNCSVQSWIDLTDWKVVASDSSKGLARSLLLAVSPSGRKLVECSIARDILIKTKFSTGTSFYTLDRLGSSDPVFFPIPKGRPADMFTGGGGSIGSCSAVCTGYNYVGWGRVAGASEVRLSIGNSPVTKVPVRNGWFAFTWEVRARFGVKTQPKVVAYDHNGKVVRTFA